jgi:hypothetical protein
MMTKINTKESILEFMKQEGFEVEEKEENVLILTDEDGYTSNNG